MIEHENLKEALIDLYALSIAEAITIQGKEISFKELQELYRERIINVIDLLGHESIYLGSD